MYPLEHIAAENEHYVFLIMCGYCFIVSLGGESRLRSKFSLNCDAGIDMLLSP